MHWEAYGGFLPQVGMSGYEQTAMATGGRYLGIPPSIRDYAGGRLGVDGDLHLQAP